MRKFLITMLVILSLLGLGLLTLGGSNSFELILQKEGIEIDGRGAVSFELLVSFIQFSLHVITFAILVFILNLVILYRLSTKHAFPAKVGTNIILLIFLVTGVYLIGSGGYLALIKYPELADHLFDNGRSFFVKVIVQHFALGLFCITFVFTIKWKLSKSTMHMDRKD